MNFKHLCKHHVTRWTPALAPHYFVSLALLPAPAHCETCSLKFQRSEPYTDKIQFSPVKNVQEPGFVWRKESVTRLSSPWRTRNVAGVGGVGGVGCALRALVASNETPTLHPQASTKDKRIPLSGLYCSGRGGGSNSSGPCSHLDSYGPQGGASCGISPEGFLGPAED